MYLDALMNSIVGHFCGLCCSTPSACEKCLGHTLRCNGFDDTEKNRARIRGLKKDNPSYEHGWGFSEMAKELGKMRAEEPDE